MGGKCHSGNWQYPGLWVLHQDVFPIEVFFFKETERSRAAWTQKWSPSPILEGLAYKEGITKKVAMKEMLIWYFFRHVTLMNTEREVKKPFQQVYRLFSQKSKITAMKINLCFGCLHQENGVCM